jgi:hypothetical protein
MKKITTIYSIPEFKSNATQVIPRPVIAIKCTSERQKFLALLHLTKKGYTHENKLKKAPCFIFCRLGMPFLYVRKHFTSEKVITTLIADNDFKYLL